MVCKLRRSNYFSIQCFNIKLLSNLWFLSKKAKKKNKCLFSWISFSHEIKVNRIWFCFYVFSLLLSGATHFCASAYLVSCFYINVFFCIVNSWLFFHLVALYISFSSIMIILISQKNIRSPHHPHHEPHPCTHNKYSQKLLPILHTHFVECRVQGQN